MMQSDPITLNKLFRHGGVTHPSIELGSIVLYLDNYPKVIKKVVHNNNRTEQIFFMPDIESISKEALDAIDHINKEKDAHCSINIAQTKEPQKGLKITIAYNDQQVGIFYNRFDSISLQKGVVFRLYNNKLINDIKNTSKPIIQMAFNTPPRVIIDCGHGGTDCGAIGCHNVVEKEVSLQVGLQVASLLKEKNIPVFLTRADDQTVLLDKRTSFANAQAADLFVSIHANAAPNKKSAGIETYCLKEELFLTDHHSEIPSLFHEILKTKYTKSYQLAHNIHQSILSTIPTAYCVIDRQVKYNVAQVLLGTIMPAILVEIGYVTHEKEAALLAQKQYQSFIAQGIVRGIESYLSCQKSV
jgi:N-acetylmuramoyl-L-alanine amidase